MSEEHHLLKDKINNSEKVMKKPKKWKEIPLLNLEYVVKEEDLEEVVAILGQEEDVCQSRVLKGTLMM